MNGENTINGLLHATGLPSLIVSLVLTAAFSFVIGLAYHGYRRSDETGVGFGTTRTFTLIGVLGFLLLNIGIGLDLYALGLGALVAFLAIFYWHGASEGNISLIGPLLALFTYLTGPLVTRFPIWLLVAVVVGILLMLEAKPTIRRFSDRFPGEEMATLAKFLIMVGVILPLLPEHRIAPFLSITYYQVWIAVLAVSGLSYLSYLSQTYLLKRRGMLLTGLLGGLYSSTAATVVLARQSRERGGAAETAPALMLATAMMYLRLWILIMVLNHAEVAYRLLWSFAAFVAIAVAAAWLVARHRQTRPAVDEHPAPSHPLQFRTALLFAVLFVTFAGLTQVVLHRFGTSGLQVLSFLTGVTDIDPFILSLLAGKFSITTGQIVGAVLIATGSNNLLKAGYAVALARNRNVIPAVLLLTGLFALSLAIAFLRIS